MRGFIEPPGDSASRDRTVCEYSGRISPPERTVAEGSPFSPRRLGTAISVPSPWRRDKSLRRLRSELIRASPRGPMPPGPPHDRERRTQGGLRPLSRSGEYLHILDTAKQFLLEGGP